MMIKKTFTPTEVGTLIENFDTKLSLVAEEVSALSKWRFTVDHRLVSLEKDMAIVKDAIRIMIPDHEKRITHLEAEVEVRDE